MSGSAGVGIQFIQLGGLRVHSVVKDGPAANSTKPPLPGDMLVKVHNSLARARALSLSTHTHTHTHAHTHTHTHTHTHKHTHKVDGYDVRGLSPTELPQWIMGEEGSVVTLSFEGANVRYDTSVVRGAVPAPDMTTHPCVALPRRSSAVRRAR